MKRTFMIAFTLPVLLSEEFLALIPQQRLYVDNLMADGVIKSYSLAIDRSRLWVVVMADSEAGVREVIEGMPLRDYMQPSISELMFHNEAEHLTPFSLN